MKNIVLILTLIATGVVAYGQNNIPDIKVITEFDTDEVKLRWLPTSYDLWELGVENGYTVVRMASTDANTISFDTLVTGLKPIPENQWDAQFSNNNAAASAKMMLYDQTINTAPDVITTAGEAFELREQREGRYLFAMVAAENDYNVAKAMALGFVDGQVDANTDVNYQVFITGEENNEEIEKGFAATDFSDGALPNIENLKGISDTDAMMLSWNISHIPTAYSTWNIERSQDSVTFLQINEDPFIHGYSEDKFEHEVTYQNLIENCEGQFYYRVQGITPFGTLGPWSNCVKIECPRPKLVMPISINGSQDKDGDIFINWHTFDDLYQDSIVGFNVYRSNSMSETPQKINGSMLSAQEREYLDTDGVSSGYYFLEAIDIYDNPHRSAEFFVQLYDEIPPEAPVGLTGQFTKSQVLTLKWDANAEDDVTGYHVYVANSRNATYIRKSEKLVKGTGYNVGFNKGLATDTVFVKINAEDQFFNTSEYSDVMAIARPDVWAPGKPILEFAYPTPEGVALAWTYSGSSDVRQHKVQRRLKSSYNWKDLLIISKDNEVNFGQTKAVSVGESKANHIDSHKLKTEEYYYRIVAMDDGDNEASSDWLTVTPFPVGPLDVIKNFKVNIIRTSTPPSPELVSQLQKVGSPNLNEQIEALTQNQYNASLSWTCNVTDKLEGFVIYRAMSGSGFKPIRTISAEEAMGYDSQEIEIHGNLGQENLAYMDKDLEKGKRYAYYVAGKYKSGVESEKSKTITKSIK